jgi:predicted acylesterase/phospholipase RssA
VSPAPAVSGSFSAAVVPVGTTQPLTASNFIPGQKPGNVAVCLSGGGSRALTAGMGQLNALQTVQYAPNMSLLSQAKALSTVSGGSWLGVPFAYLPPSVSDVNYLGGPYVQPASLTPASLGALPSDCMAANITSDFTLLDMVVQAVLLYWEGVPADMLWQTIIALQLLAPYGLFTYTGGSDTPDSLFSYDQNALNAILKANPSLRQEPANLVSGQPRPYLVCNTAMFVTANGQSRLAPVQATSFMTGIVSAPGGTDANGFQVGGGGVTSFAFNSAPTAFNASPSQVTAVQQRQWSLLDIVGSSSAAFAATLQETVSSYASHPEQLAQAMLERGPAASNFLVRSGVRLLAGRSVLASALLAHTTGDLDRISAAAFALSDLVPAYRYWPAANPPVGSTINPTKFADGGSLENSGIAAMLAYGDIDNIIAFTNTSTPITKEVRASS